MNSLYGLLYLALPTVLEVPCLSRLTWPRLGGPGGDSNAPFGESLGQKFGARIPVKGTHACCVVVFDLSARVRKLLR